MYHKELYSEPNPMEGEIKEDRNPGGWMGWTAIGQTRGQRLDALCSKTGREGEIFLNQALTRYWFEVYLIIIDKIHIYAKMMTMYDKLEIY
jgi:hypothetical protein